MPPLNFYFMQVWTNKDNGGPVNSYDYNMMEFLGVTVMRRSDDIDWTNPGEQVLEMKDDGNNITITIGKKKKFVINYEEEVQLLAALLHNYKGSLELRESQTIKSI